MDVSITGLDGLAAIRARRPDLILLDMHLPDISGLELLRHLKADPTTADIPIVVVSADALAQQIDDGARRRRRALPDQAGQRRRAARRSSTTCSSGSKPASAEASQAPFLLFLRMTGRDRAPF